MDITSAVVGASIALIVRGMVDRHDRIKEKQKNCYHDFYETKYYGIVTRHCRKCNYQEPVNDRDKGL